MVINQVLRDRKDFLHVWNPFGVRHFRDLSELVRLCGALTSRVFFSRRNQPDNPSATEQTTSTLT